MIEKTLLLSLLIGGFVGATGTDPDRNDDRVEREVVVATATTGLSGELRATWAPAGTPVSLGLEWVEEVEGMVRYDWVRIDGQPGERSLGQYRLDGNPRAPDTPGAWKLHLEGDGWQQTLTEPVVIVPVPLAERNGTQLNGYRLGVWPAERTRREGRYAPPRYLFEVTEATRNLPVSTHLRLGDFLTKDQHDVWPKYVALDFRLLDKLELVVAELRRMGVRAETIHVMSGFRTPHYNDPPHGSGRALYSRHTYGDAADIWIDNTGEGRMSDLNGDGRVDLHDARIIEHAVNRVEARHPQLIGGVGIYPAFPGGSPWVHIDVRGSHSRW